jgi:hypothetical protein
MSILIPNFGADKDQLFDFLHKNRNQIIRAKKSVMKAPMDGFSLNFTAEETTDKEVQKEFGIAPLDAGAGKTIARCAINATNVIDSHLDLHLPKLFNRSVKANKDPLHLNLHRMNDWDAVIADGPDEVKTYVKTVTWRSIGWDFEGKTDILMHDVKFTGRNPEMEDRYLKGHVKYHSVGMHYLDFVLCANTDSKYMREEKDNYDQYITQAINPEVAEEYGYFWAVKEAKEVEGSSVVRGSCPATPTISIFTESEKFTSDDDTTDKSKGSSDDTLERIKQIKYF